MPIPDAELTYGAVRGAGGNPLELPTGAVGKIGDKGGSWHDTDAYDDYAAAEAAAEALDGTGRGVRLSPRTYDTNANLTLGKLGVPLEIAPGAVLKPPAGRTYTIAGPLSGVGLRHFIDLSDGGVVEFASRAISHAFAEWWGATVDGPDSTAAINAAIQAARVVTLGGSGAYTINKTDGVDTMIILRDDTWLRGQGPQTVLKVGEVTGELSFPIRASSTEDRITLSDFTLDGNRDSYGGAWTTNHEGLEIDARDVTIRNVTVRNVVSDAIDIDAGQNCTIDNVRIYDCGGRALNLTGAPVRRHNLSNIHIRNASMQRDAAIALRSQQINLTNVFVKDSNDAIRVFGAPGEPPVEGGEVNISNFVAVDCVRGFVANEFIAGTVNVSNMILRRMANRGVNITSAGGRIEFHGLDIDEVSLEGGVEAINHQTSTTEVTLFGGRVVSTKGSAIHSRSGSVMRLRGTEVVVDAFNAVRVASRTILSDCDILHTGAQHAVEVLVSAEGSAIRTCDIKAAGRAVWVRTSDGVVVDTNTVERTGSGESIRVDSNANRVMRNTSRAGGIDINSGSENRAIGNDVPALTDTGTDSIVRDNVVAGVFVRNDPA